MKAVFKIARNHARIIEVKSADGDGVIQQYAVICNIQHACQNA
jgi:hypothetical protein